MWNDVETSQDLLNFKIIAETAAAMIREGNGQPISIGVSGSWGSGKSSLVKMIGESLKTQENDNSKYVFIDFNAWLYQGYDDARMALLQKVADTLMKEAKEARNQETVMDKVRDFIKRIDWLRAIKFIAPVGIGAITGTTFGGSLGSFLGSLSGLFSRNEKINSKEIEELKQSYHEIEPELSKILKEKEKKSIPQEIADLRAVFEEILKELNLTLIVLVDDLDRCLPDTAISTLEAMRLLLLVPQTAFIIAADEQMIRNAVRSHFGNIDLSDELVTSYFDKLIQIPLRVPRLGTNEIKGYLILLLADLAQRRGKITMEEKENGQVTIISAVKKSWSGGLTKKIIENAYGESSQKIATEIDMADQLAHIMASSDHIAGNPRLIKRFLNNLIIRESIAKAQEMSISFDALVKLQLFERCAVPATFDYLVKEVADCADGKPKFLTELENSITKGENAKFPEGFQECSFLLDWLKINPPLSGLDLRPLLYLSRDKSVSLASFDELSPAGRELLSALCEIQGFMDVIVGKIKQIGLTEAEKILTRMIRRLRAEQWVSMVTIQAFHLPKAFPELVPPFVAMLKEIPTSHRPIPLIPHLLNEPWAAELLSDWERDPNSSAKLKKAIGMKRKK